MTDVPTERLVEILEGCEGVTLGPWKHTGAHQDWTIGIDSEITEEAVVWPSCIPREGEAGIRSTTDALHLTRLDPRTVSAVITELLNLRSQSAQARAEGYAAGLEKAKQIADMHKPRQDLLPYCNADMNQGAYRGMYEAREEISDAIEAAIPKQEEQP